MKKKHTAHSLTIKHKSARFSKNRKEEEMEQEGKMKHAKKHMKHMKSKHMEHKMACKHCKSTSHTSAEHNKHMKKKAAVKEQTEAARYENMRRKVFGLKKKNV